MPVNHIYVDGKKYMWDGETYPGANEAEAAKKKYEEDGFDVRISDDEGVIAVYTRRIVTEIVVEGSPV